MSDAFISYAQNGEDVVLWRALGNVSDGRYVDVGACEPEDLSVTKALYDRGWRGIDIDAVPVYTDQLRRARPDNEVVQAAITDRDVDSVTFHHLIGTGLSTLDDETAAEHERAGYELEELIVPTARLDSICADSHLLDGELHVLKVDVEGAEAEVLRSFDLARWRPWVVVVEATRPLTTELNYHGWDPILTAAGYECVLFDGLSRFYLAPDHFELRPLLSYPACVLDDFVTIANQRLAVRLDNLTGELGVAYDDALRWRNESVAYWANAVARAQVSADQAAEAHEELERSRNQLGRVRETLRDTREDRRRLRAEVKRLTGRVRKLKSRIATQETPPPVPAGRLHRVVRRVVKK